MRAIPAPAAAVLPRHPPPVRAGDAGVDCVALKVIRYQVQMFDDAANSQLDGRLVEGLPA